MKIKQFTLWTNCNNKCTFCYQQHIKAQTIYEKLSAISKVKEIIQTDFSFDTLGLIGGEFFQGQLYGCKGEFLDLIDCISKANNILQVWVTASLLTKKQDGLFETISLLKNKDLYICTSYDIEGRFKEENIWWTNYRQLLDKTKTHVEIIYTDAFCNKLITKNTKFIDEIITNSFLNFKLPNIYIEDYIKFKENISLENYIKIRNSSLYMPNFFLSNRAKFLESAKILTDKGINVLKAINGHSSSDYTYTIIPCDFIEKDKWNIGAPSNAPCGHFWDGRSYLDSDKCILCDLQALYGN